MGGLRRGQTRYSRAHGRLGVIDTCRSQRYRVGKVFHRFIYTTRRATVSGHRLVVGVPRASDDSITRATSLVSIAIIRRKLEERLAAGARKHTQIYACTRRCTRGYILARVTWSWITALGYRLRSLFLFAMRSSLFPPALPSRNENVEYTTRRI